MSGIFAKLDKFLRKQGESEVEGSTTQIDMHIDFTIDDNRGSPPLPHRFPSLPQSRPRPSDSPTSPHCQQPRQTTQNNPGGTLAQIHTPRLAPSSPQSTIINPTLSRSLFVQILIPPNYQPYSFAHANPSSTLVLTCKLTLEVPLSDYVHDPSASSRPNWMVFAGNHEDDIKWVCTLQSCGVLSVYDVYVDVYLSTSVSIVFQLVWGVVYDACVDVYL
eukprot:840369-Amorphochlora_amoeboformis.AAC.1